MEQSPSWEANSHLGSQIPPLLWDPKVHYHVHEGPPPVPILSQMHPVHSFLPCFFKIHSNDIFPSMLGSCNWSLPFRFSIQNIVCISHPLNACYMSCPSNLPLFDHPSNILWSVQVMMILIMQPSPASCHFSLFCWNILLSTLFSNTLNLCSSFGVRDQVSHPFKTIDRILVFVYFKVFR